MIREMVQTKTHLLSTYKELIQLISVDISLIQLRPKFTPDLDSYFLGDTDFIIRDKDFEHALFIIYEYCKNNGINFYLDQNSVNKKRFEFFVENHDTLCMVLEFWTAVEITENGKKKAISSDSIFKAIANKTVSKEEILTLIYITHLHHKKKDIFTEENKYRFKTFLQWLNKQIASERIYSISDLLKRLQDKKLNLREANQKALNFLTEIDISKNSNFNFKQVLYKEKIFHKLFNLKNIVPIVGPDGVGKGSVSELSLSELENKRWLSYRFKQLYRVKKLYVLRLKLLKKQKNQPKNKLDEEISYYIFFTALLFIRLLAYKKKNKFVLLDRYFIDYFGTPIRYLKEYRKPQKVKLYDLLLFLTPTPNKMVFMSCRNTSLIERKNELSNVAVDFLQKLNCEFIRLKKPKIILFLSTENSKIISAKALQSFLQKIN